MLLVGRGGAEGGGKGLHDQILISHDMGRIDANRWEREKSGKVSYAFLGPGEYVYPAQRGTFSSKAAVTWADECFSLAVLTPEKEFSSQP